MPFGHRKKRTGDKKRDRGSNEHMQVLYRPEDLVSSNVIPPRPPREFEKLDKNRFPHAIVKADFVPQNSDELPAREYDLVVLLRRVDDNWYQACTLDKKNVGYIPRNYLDVLIDVADLPSELPKITEKPLIESPFGRETASISGIYQDIATSVSEYTPRPPPVTPVVDRKVKKLREPDDYFFTVLETFIPESEDDIGGTAGEIMLWIDDRAIPGRPIPEDWIYCMNLGGRRGTFPGNFAKALNSSLEIERLLQSAAHAIATKTIRRAAKGYVRIEEGEAMYIDRLEEQFIYGRTASGHIGKLPLDHCEVIVPP
ncbi:hypothetical protein Aperf_G00000033861 [Anoplocephala perfoliata]